MLEQPYVHLAVAWIYLPCCRILVQQVQIQEQRCGGVTKELRGTFCHRLHTCKEAVWPFLHGLGNAIASHLCGLWFCKGFGTGFLTGTRQWPKTGKMHFCVFHSNYISRLIHACIALPKHALNSSANKQRKAEEKSIFIHQVGLENGFYWLSKHDLLAQASP